jgi:hypothetical protein
VSTPRAHQATRKARRAPRRRFVPLAPCPGQKPNPIKKAVRVAKLVHPDRLAQFLTGRSARRNIRGVRRRQPLLVAARGGFRAFVRARTKALRTGVFALARRTQQRWGSATSALNQARTSASSVCGLAKLGERPSRTRAIRTLHDDLPPPARGRHSRLGAGSRSSQPARPSECFCSGCTGHQLSYRVHGGAPPSNHFGAARPASRRLMRA